MQLIMECSSTVVLACFTSVDLSHGVQVVRGSRYPLERERDRQTEYDSVLRPVNHYGYIRARRGTDRQTQRDRDRDRQIDRHKEKQKKKRPGHLR